jgi:hypothetical protein
MALFLGKFDGESVQIGVGQGPEAFPDRPVEVDFLTSGKGFAIQPLVQ